MNYVPPFLKSQIQVEKDPNDIKPNLIEIDQDNYKVITNSNIKLLTSFSQLPFAISAKVSKLYKSPSIIQKFCIPVLMANHNLLCRAPTGMGKTMCFLIPIMHKIERGLHPQCCIVAPTRELCEQIKSEALKIMTKKLKVVCVYGKKAEIGSYEHVDIIVATPGRLLDNLNKKRIVFTNLKYFILDEADKLLDMGFEEPIREIHGFISNAVQTALFSATYSLRLSKIISYYLKSKISVEIKTETLESIKQEIIEVRDKKTELLRILRSNEVVLKGSWRSGLEADKILIFVDKKSDCVDVERFLRRNSIPACSLHGDKDQPDRQETLNNFKKGLYNVMVATSVVARGIDVKDVRLVINYDIPKDIKEYIHRIGRTGREGKQGKAISFYDNKVTRVQTKALLEILQSSKNEVPNFMLKQEDFMDRFQRLKLSTDKDASDDEQIGLWQ